MTKRVFVLVRQLRGNPPVAFATAEVTFTKDEQFEPLKQQALAYLDERKKEFIAVFAEFTRADFYIQESSKHAAFY